MLNVYSPCPLVWSSHGQTPQGVKTRVCLQSPLWWRAAQKITPFQFLWCIIMIAPLSGLMVTPGRSKCGRQILLFFKPKQIQGGEGYGLWSMAGGYVLNLDQSVSPTSTAAIWIVEKSNCESKIKMAVYVGIVTIPYTTKSFLPYHPY